MKTRQPTIEGSAISGDDGARPFVVSSVATGKESSQGRIVKAATSNDLNAKQQSERWRLAWEKQLELSRTRLSQMERKGEGSRGALGGESVSSLADNAATDNGAAEGGPQRYLDADLLEASPRPHWWSAAFIKDTSVPPARDAEQDGSRRQYLDTDGPQVRGRVQDTTPESSAVSRSLLDEVDIGVRPSDVRRAGDARAWQDGVFGRVDQPQLAFGAARQGRRGGYVRSWPRADDSDASRLVRSNDGQFRWRQRGMRNLLEDEAPGTGPIYRRPDSPEDAIVLILPLLILLSTLLFLLLIFVILVIFVRRRARIALQDGDGPLDVGREEELEGLGGISGVEERWLDTVDTNARRGYDRAKAWQTSYPPGSLSTDITLSQFLTIQEKGVSAFSFDPDYESNASVFVEARTEITFLADGGGMAPEEGGGSCVQSNMPLPKLNEVYYWEAKMFTLPTGTNIGLGLATKPYPSFRLPGWSKFSVGYFSQDGFKSHNYPFTAQSYGPAYVQGDVIGVGYRPRSGTVFFTRNGKKLEDAFVGLNRHNLFPTVGADGAAEVHVNLGQAGFVFIEANVKKWGLAPMVGTLAPPPAYGQERGSLLIETGQSSSAQAGGRATPPPPLTPPLEHPDVSQSHAEGFSASGRAPTRSRRHRASRRTQGRSSPESPRLPSDIQIVRNAQGQNSPPRRDSASSADAPHNPPTPNALDISLHQLPPHQLAADGNMPEAGSAQGEGLLASYFPRPGSRSGSTRLGNGGRRGSDRSPSPPPYPGASDGRSVGTWSDESAHRRQHQTRSLAGRTSSIANAFMGALADRGLLASLPGSPNVEDPNVRDAERHRILDVTTARNTDANRRGNDAAAAAERPGTAQSVTTWVESWFRS